MHDASRRDNLKGDDKTRFCVTAISDYKRPQASYNYVVPRVGLPFPKLANFHGKICA